MRSIRISEKTAKELLAYFDDEQVTVSAQTVRELRSAIRPKPSSTSYAKQKRKKKASRRDEAAAIRAQVMARAGGRCECGCEHNVYGEDESFLFVATMDHFWGRGKTKQTVENCWCLAIRCHDQKTMNFPNAATWLCKFITHAQKHGYTSEASRARARLEALELISQAEKVSGGGG